MTEEEKKEYRKAFSLTNTLVLKSYIESSKGLIDCLQDILNMEEREQNEIYKSAITLRELAKETLEKRISSMFVRF